MRVRQLKQYLNALPDEMVVMVQTCEGNLCAPLEFENIWQTQAFIDERDKALQPVRVVITSFIKGKERTSYKNEYSGVIAVYPEESKVEE